MMSPPVWLLGPMFLLSGVSVSGPMFLPGGVSVFGLMFLPGGVTISGPMFLLGRLCLWSAVPPGGLSPGESPLQRPPWTETPIR